MAKSLYRIFCRLLLSLPLVSLAAASDNQRSELTQQQEELRSRIGALQQDLSKNEVSKATVANQLRVVESSILAANRKLGELAANRAAVQTQLTQLEQQSLLLAQQIDHQQTQLSRLLYHQFVDGSDDALHLLLSGEDPNQSARNRHFLTLLSRQKAELLSEMRNSLQQKKQLADATRVKNEELAAIEKLQQQERATLLAQQNQRQGLLAQIAARIHTQQKQIDTLKGNEKRLGRLIGNLLRQTAKAKSRQPRHVIAATTKRAEAVPEPSLAAAGGAFAALRGQLTLPVRGTIADRFGSPRGDTGTVWKGVFIRAAVGSEVHAVADGTVVYADWLRGFGNLMIVDHGDGFLSVYGNNGSLLRATSAPVKGGESIATVGSSGGNEDSGLYFELRHQGQPFDPLRWISLK